MSFEKVRIWFEASFKIVHLKFDKIILTFGFKENEEENCIYVKFKGSRFTILFLYVDDIVLACSDKDILHATRDFYLQILI